MFEEQQYWYNRATNDSIYAERQHEAIMNSLHQELDFKLMQMLKPSVFKEGDQWCVLYGDNLQDGVAGFGYSPHLAVLDFNKNWYTKNS